MSRQCCKVVLRIVSCNIITFRANRKALQCKIKVLTIVLYIVVSYLMYGPYGSFAPTYDSSRATITKEESDLLYSTYGDDTGIHYAKR